MCMIRAFMPTCWTHLGSTCPEVPSPVIGNITCERRKRRDNTVIDAGLRFDYSVPVETILLGPVPELVDVPDDKQLVIAEKVGYRRTQHPGSYVVLTCVCPVIKDTDDLVHTIWMPLVIVSICH